jgi:homoserine O-succinyltransferase/O-acetyltransferase
MPLTISSRRPVTPSRHRPAGSQGAADSIVVALVNNMPDPALEATATQFASLLEAAAGPRSVALRLTYLPEVPRGAPVKAYLERNYWPIDEALGTPVDALIVTGLEPKAQRLTDEPYWPRLARLVEWAERHARSCIWSCLAAHAAALHADRIERQRLDCKRFGVFDHPWVEPHELTRAVRAPLATPHSRWNDLPVDSLRAAGYRILSASPQTGADVFVKETRCLHVFFQGHPEYEATTLLKEFRRDAGRFLRGEQSRYPDPPSGYFAPAALEALEAFRERATREAAPDLIQDFPTQAAAAGLRLRWQAPAATIYRNWIDLLAASRSEPNASAPVKV